MADPKHLEILQDGIETWNRWREEHQDITPDLSEADLSDGYYTSYDAKVGPFGINFSRANLRSAKLRNSELFEANFAGAILDNADLCGAALHLAGFTNASCTAIHLQEGTLTNAFLTEARFVRADLWRANLTGAYLRGADFTEARVYETVFDDTDLSEVRGLETVEHDGPSVIGVAALYASRGRIPETFLRGCGIPESFIPYLPSLIGAEEGIQFYSCFISHSSRDGDFARRLHGRMRDARLRVWYAPEDIRGGEKLHEQIDTAIRVYDKLLIVLSEASLQSEWVMTELRKARKAERQSGKRKLFPVRLVEFETLRDWECFDADSGKDLALEVREYFIPDFSNWKSHDAFESAFARLLSDLKQSDSQAVSV